MTGKAVSYPIHKGTTEPQRQADMRIELLNVECEFQVSVVSGRRNTHSSYELSDLGNPRLAQ